MSSPLVPLPIDEVLYDIVDVAQRASSLVIQAPPGAGKTTRVPPALSKVLPPSGQIIMVQPRRLAARTSAARIAFENDWRLGQEVGYQVRFERKATQDTRILVVTEGVLLKRLQADPCLSDVVAVILDEFHERRLDTDLLLGMLRRVQESVRPDLRIVVMSATLDAEPVASFLHPAHIITSQGRAFPVEVRHAKFSEKSQWLDTLASTTLEAVQKHAGDTLVFLPGVGEIHRLQQILSNRLPRGDFDLLPLYADLPVEQQDLALRKSQRRKIVLSTNVAETSITIDGIVTVIDCGLARVLRHDPDVGLDKLQLEAISQASAAQRAGRAGRTAPGVCYRIWDEPTHRTRPAFTQPEVQRIDLATAVLQLLCWGERDILAFPWFEKPREDAVLQALHTLRLLGAIEEDEITALGKQMAALPLHPRLARLLIESDKLGGLRQAAIAAAILSERDPIQRRLARNASTGRGAPPTRQTIRSQCDLLDRVEAIQEYQRTGRDDFEIGPLHHGAAQQVLRAADQLERSCRYENTEHDPDIHVGRKYLGPALIAAFPDRVAKRRDAGKARGLMVGGRGVRVSDESNVQDAELFLCLQVSGEYQGDALARIVSAVDSEWLVGPSLQDKDELLYHPSQKQVVARRRRYWNDLLIQETPISAEDTAAVAELLYQHASAEFELLFPQDDEVVGGWLARVRCLHQWMPELQLPAFDRESILDVLKSLCHGRRSISDLKSAPWREALEGALTGEQLHALQKHAPERMQLPKGHRAKIVYEVGKPPVLAARIQDFFGWTDTPRIAGGKVRLQLHLLAPNQRCQQITEDLASFWKNTYETVRKELKRRYPKHSWPENPLVIDSSDGTGGSSKPRK